MTTQISMSKTTRYGHFELSGMVNGERVSVITTNSEAFDWYNDNDNEEKHAEAIAYCERTLTNAYNYKHENYEQNF